MDSETSSIDFAAIGHQDNWANIKMFIDGIRGSEYEQLPVEKIKDIFGFIPPRAIFKMKITSKSGNVINGVYIDTFIDPDKLEPQYVRLNIKKVRNAIAVAQKLNAKIIALGGFTSIVLEGNINAFANNKIKLTTGNSLTSAYILKGVEKAANNLKISLIDSKVLVVGATGDIGMACVHYLKNKVNQLLLCARNEKRLEEFAIELLNQNKNVIYSSNIGELIPDADIIISVASSRNIEINQIKKKVLICDAGYPKNFEQKIENFKGISLFHGGMGQIQNGFVFNPDYSSHFYNYPAPFIGHGCILEAIVLAFEDKFENYSAGKGLITNEKIDEIYNLGLKHGLVIAPFYNTQGLW